MGGRKDLEAISKMKDYMELNMQLTLGQKLGILREESGRTLDEVAKVVGIQRTTLNNYERDFRKPRYDTIAKLADYYNVSTDYLLGMDDTPPEKDPDDNTQVLLQTLKGASKREIDQAIKIITALKGTMPDD